jgi:hypothetical protein
MDGRVVVPFAKMTMSLATLTNGLAAHAPDRLHD